MAHLLAAGPLDGGNIGVEIGKIGVGCGHETLARKLEHGRDDAQIGDVAGADLAVHHHAACQGEVDHRRDPQERNAAF